MILARAIGLAVAVLVVACGGDDLKKLKTPRAGVRLAYDLQPGATFEGHLKIGTTREITGVKEHLNQNVECDAKLIVLGRDDEQGGNIVAARFQAIDLDWGVAPDAELSRDEYLKLASDELRGLELRWVVSDRGKVLQRPEPPETLAEPMHELFDVLASSVGVSFVELPDRGLRPGDRWTETGEVQRIDGQFEGLFEGKDGEGSLARLELVFDASRVVQTESGEKRAQTEGTTKGLFSTTGFFTTIAVEARDFDPRVGMGVRQIAATWKKTGKGQQDATSVQTITDPCDPDYVGAVECTKEIVEPTPREDEGGEAPAPEEPVEEPSGDEPVEEPVPEEASDDEPSE